MSAWKRFRRQEGTDLLCREFVEECAAFLDGRLVEALEARKVPVPMWAWSNLLAHGSMEQLRLASLEECKRRADEYSEWRKSRSQLARLMLASARSFGPLLALQECALIPLELMLAAQSEICTPEGWVGQVETALRFHKDILRAMNLEGDSNPQKGELQ